MDNNNNNNTSNNNDTNWQFQNLPKYKRLTSILRQDIIEGKILPGQQFLTELEIAKKFNVSRGITREAIQSLVHEGLLMRIAGKGTFVNEFDKPGIESLNQVITNVNQKVISIFIPTMAVYGVAIAMIRAIEDVAFSRGYQVTISNTDNDFHKLDAYYKQSMVNHTITGILFMPLLDDVNYEKNLDFVNHVRQQKIPIVVIDRLASLKTDTKVDYDYIMADNKNGGYLAVKHLIELGHRNIAFIGGYVSYSGEQRVAGYKQALSENGIAIDEKLIRRFDIVADWEKNNELLRFLASLKGKTTAIFAEHDLVARSILFYLQKLNIKVPEDISIIGFDDLEFVQHFAVPLTTVRQPAYDVGKIATEILFDKIEGKLTELKQIVLPVQLVIRDSTEKPKKNGKKNLNINQEEMSLWQEK
jgi:GntR family transcriptional regulator of arabinose operon